MGLRFVSRTTRSWDSQFLLDGMALSGVRRYVATDAGTDSPSAQETCGVAARTTRLLNTLNEPALIGISGNMIGIVAQGTTGPQGRAHDADLYACVEPRWARRSQSGRHAGAGLNRTPTTEPAGKGDRSFRHQSTDVMN